LLSSLTFLQSGTEETVTEKTVAGFDESLAERATAIRRLGVVG